MRKYYFYGQQRNWYTFTTDIIREEIDKCFNEEGKPVTPFPVMFVFTGKSTEATDKDEAEANYRRRENLVNCKEPACMLLARRRFFEQEHTGI